MGKDLQSVNGTGRLTRDCSIRVVTNDFHVGNFAIAVNDSVKRNGKYVDEVSFFDCTVLGNLAKNLGKYLLKGKQIAYEGRLKQERWEDSNGGGNRSKVVIILNSIQLLGGSNNSSARETEEAFKAEDGGEQFNDETDF